MDSDDFSGRLLPGERVIWSGRAGAGIMFTAQDIFLVPFSLIWCGFAVFWTVMASGHGAPVFFDVFGLAFVCVGVYFVAGRFVVDAWIRSGLRYAVTDRRALILRSGPLSDFTAVSLDRLADIRLKEEANGRGTIRFGRSAGVWGGRGVSWSPALDPTPAFLAIDDVRRVFDLVQRHQADRA